MVLCMYVTPYNELGQYGDLWKDTRLLSGWWKQYQCLLLGNKDNEVDIIHHLCCNQKQKNYPNCSSISFKNSIEPKKQAKQVT